MDDRALAAVLRKVRDSFARAGIATADLDARLIVEHMTGTTRVDAISNPNQEVTPEALANIGQAVARRLSGEPVHRILGFREFYGLELLLSPETLEPRPDTEILVDAVLPAVRRMADAKGTCRILDIGTGTGAIALALLHEESRATALGIDISQSALDTAAANSRRLGLESRFSVLKSSWFEFLTGEFDVIVSNPPYIKTTDIPKLECEVRNFDPAVALDGGEDGLAAYRAIVEGAASHLVPDGIIAVEIGFDQAADCCKIFTENGFVFGRKHEDLGKNDRVLVFFKGKNLDFWT